MELLQSDSALPNLSTLSNKLTTLGRKPRIKWFIGEKMHRSLEIAARHGVEDIRELLVAVGNDINVVNTNMSVSKLIARLQI